MKRIQIHLQAHNLKNKAHIFKGISDPYCILRLASSLDTEIGRTSSIKNEIKNPDWVECITFQYDEQSMGTYIKVEIWDDNRGKNPDVKMVETSLISLPQVMELRDQGLTYKFDEGGSLTIHAVQLSDVAPQPHTSHFVLHLRALNVKNVEKRKLLGLGKTDPFIEIRKKYNNFETGIPRWKVVYRSEWVSNHLNPMFEKVSIPIEQFCDNDLQKDLKVLLYDYEPDGDHKCLGEMEVTPDILMRNISHAGNADRDRALEFIKGDERRKRVEGLLVILEAYLTGSSR